MIPKINQRGHSFKGVTAYLMHDRDAQSTERVEWSETGNMHTQDIEKAALVMAYIDKNSEGLKRDFGGSAAGRKAEAGNVYHYSLSWAHGENPERQHQREQALKTLERLGLSDHQYYMVAHNDTEHKHVHIVANLVNPETGKIHTPSFDKRELQAWALEYEREHILHCHKREENAQKREQGQKFKHQDQKQDYSEKITRAYYAADNGKAFIHALNEEGLKLAKARRGGYNYVVVDDQGDIQKLSRQLNIEERGKAKSEAIQNLLKDIDPETIKDADALAKEIKANIAEKVKSFDRDAQEVQQQKKLLDAAEKHGQAKAQEQEKREKYERQALKKKPEALQAKRDEANKKRLEYLERERERLYQRAIDQKAALSRKKWDIDDLTQKREKAEQQLQQNSGLFSRLTGKKQAAMDHLEATEKTLQERLSRFEADIKAFNDNRPGWIQQRELEKHGFKMKEPAINDNLAQKPNEPEIQAARADDQKFSQLGKLRSPEELKKIIESQQASNGNDLRNSFEAGLKQTHKETLQRYKEANPQQEEKEQEAQSQTRRQGHSINHD